jgi:hypothetical protein
VTSQVAEIKVCLSLKPRKPQDVIILQMRKWILVALLAVAFFCLAGIFVYNTTAVHYKFARLVNEAQARVFYALNPPQEAVFIPQEGQVATVVEATLQAILPAVTTSPTPAPSATPTQPGPTPTPPPSPTPTLTATPIPQVFILSGLKHEYQQMNNCGPTTLAMALSFWGWQGDQRDTRTYLRPNYATVDDKNVMPSEMADYVEKFTGLKALVRVGGDLDMLKKLVAAGFPVVIEKGFQPPKEDWMGHFEVINAYDDARQRFTTQDSYIMADFPVPYNQLTDHWWRDFNSVYLVIFPPEREAEVLSILGPQADPKYNFQHAAQIALQETNQLSGRDLYFAWFNLGTNLSLLEDYAASAAAYDQAFAQYARLPEDERPWRMLWYQVGPYQAYFHSGRYQDVIDLANTTLAYMQKPVLEESFYWRGLAREQLGDIEGAISDFKKSIELNSNFTPGYQALEGIGVPTP